jgi:hypothetical protein
MRLLLLSALVACAPVPEALPGTAAAPPLGLATSGPFVTGEVAHFFVWGVPPGERVQVWGSLATTGGPACPSTLPVCLDLVGGAARLVNAVSTPQGAVLASLTVPAGLSSTDVQVQAVLADGSNLSPVVSTRIFRATDDDDADGLDNASELLVHGTDPDVADTDGGGRLDGEEILEGLDPFDPSDDEPPLRPELWSLTAGFGYDALTAEAIDLAYPGVPGIDPYLVFEGWEDRNGNTLNDPGETCAFALSSAGTLPSAPWLASNPTVLAGFDAGPLTPFNDTCTDVLDPALYDGFVDAMAAADWSFGVTPDPDPFVLSALDMVLGPGVGLGGIWFGDLAAAKGGPPDFAWSARLQADAARVVVVGPDGFPEYDLAVDALAGGFLQDGVYEVHVTVGPDELFAIP